ncbi:MAG: hypothetical protein ACRDNF_09310, partial [Streptosporangiaceae bacterium]
MRPPPGHHRTTAPAHDPYQPPALVIIDLAHAHTFSHTLSLRGPEAARKAIRANVTGYGTSWAVRWLASRQGRAAAACAAWPTG